MYTLLLAGVVGPSISSGKERLPVDRMSLSSEDEYINSLTYKLQSRRSTESKGS